MTQEQYQQMMLERQAMEQEQMMQPQGPGVAGGFMGGLLDSALAGLVPNQQYLNPQNPGNAGAAQMGGLIGMIIPMLLAKYGIKNFALPALAKEGGMLAKYLPGLGAEGMTANTAYKADMLSSILGGGIGGGLAEGPMGGLLGAAGMAGYSKFRGAGAVDDAGKLNLGELFSNKPPKAPPTTPAATTTTTGAVKEGETVYKTVQAPEEIAKAFKAKAVKVYDPKTKAINFGELVDDASGGFDTHYIGKIMVDGKETVVTPRGVIKAMQTEGSKPIKFAKADAAPKGAADKTPTFGEYKDMTIAELHEMMVSPYRITHKAKGKKDPVSAIESWAYIVDKKPIKMTEGGKVTNATEIEKKIYKDMNAVTYGPKTPYELYGTDRAAKATKTTAKATSKPAAGLDAADEQILKDLDGDTVLTNLYVTKRKEGMSPEDAMSFIEEAQSQIS